MSPEKIKDIVVDAIKSFATANDEVQIKSVLANELFAESGIDELALEDIFEDLKNRFSKPGLEIQEHLIPENFNLLTLEVFTGIFLKLFQANQVGKLVFIDDEAENHLVFKRAFKKHFDLECFLDSEEAIQKIKTDPDVALVVTDEVMPGYRGNDVCDEIKKVKPNMPFVLITGNPENDNGLMYKTLKMNRFFDFIQKPVNFREREEELVALFKEIMSR